MRAVEAHLTALPTPPDPPYPGSGGWDWGLGYADVLRDQGWVDYRDLACGVYGVYSPTRPQLSAVARAVGRLEQQGKVERRLTGGLTDQGWSRPTAERRGRQGTRRGFTVRRETLVRRLPDSDARG
jgi:hypothetical protein